METPLQLRPTSCWVQGAVVSKDADNYKSRMADNTEQSSEGVIFRAVTLLRDAQHSSQSFLLDDPGHFHSYLLYHNFWLKFAIRIITIIHLALPLFEEPNGNLRMELYPPITLSIEVFCISVYTLRFYHMYYITPSSIFLQDRKVYVFGICLVVSSIATQSLYSLSTLVLSYYG